MPDQGREPQPYPLAVADEVLDDLIDRVRRTRTPGPAARVARLVRGDVHHRTVAAVAEFIYKGRAAHRAADPAG